MLRLTTLLLSCLLLAAASAAPAAMRIYVFDCGHALFKDMATFSDTGEYDGKTGEIAVPCFLIRHPKGDLLWDLGLGDHYAANKEGTDVTPGVHIIVPVTLLDQLRSLNLSPKDIGYVGFSHLHWDHTGNANLFPEATWIVNTTELTAALALPPPNGVLPETFSVYKQAKIESIEGDYDVFGDGSVLVLKAPGHTPGHQVLKVKLQTSGTIILSGDLYHLRANRAFKRVPVYNFSRADTLASIARIETIVRNSGGRLIIQHDPKDFQALPKPPAFLD